MIAFGPVPSRRLGHSLGINNIPPKFCTYSCVYCQIGRTINMENERREFYKIEKIIEDVEKKVKEARKRGEKIDHLTFVPDGEPALDINIGKEIGFLKNLGIKIAVITNGSLIWKRDVQNDLCKADWISLKVDAVSKEIWQRIDRPHKSLDLEEILEGIAEFSKIFKGELTTETMLIKGINDKYEEIKKIASFLEKLKPYKSYISIPTRPPAEKWAVPANEHNINMAFQVFNERDIDAEYLIGYEGNAFAFTGNIEEDLLSITSVHPMREEGVKELLKKADADWGVVEKLIRESKLIEIEYQGKKY
ncbi:MAG TPA: radical SAM protein, partial [Methanomicrobia archaeon]|nr:radical SAM protein [Methanomicrobia archaeon]